jgi:methyl-accepting chemotaxis protein
MLKGLASSKIRLQIFLSYLAIALLLTGVGTVTYAAAGQIRQRLLSVSASQKQLSRAQQIVWLDEVLTQSMRNYVLTQQPSWRSRYDTYLPQLDSLIGEARANATTAEMQALFDQQQVVNDELAALEDDALDLMAVGKPAQALALLDGPQYQRAKATYAETVTGFLNDSQNGLAAVEADLNGTLDLAARLALAVFWGSLLLGLAIATLAYVLAARITRPILATAALAQQVADGDLRLHIPPGGEDEIGLMLNALRAMTQRLGSVIQDEQRAAQRMLEVSAHLNQAAQGLSLGNAKQAAGLAQTTAAVQEMNAIVNHNAEQADHTHQAAAQSVERVDEGSKAVAETVQVLQEIIAKIDVIEDIAEQTNILALNATMEATRAGEHGRGFAVVAKEVRQLAAHSRTAAEEITALADRSMAVSRRTGSLFQQIVPSIQQTATLMADISRSSGEQNHGIAQINSAMVQLDQVTQHNAAAAEQLAASSRDMATQAAQLQQALAYFKLGE